MAVLVWIVILGLCVYVGVMQHLARQQVTVQTPLGKLAVQEIIDQTFGSMWMRTAGPGHVNVRPKMRAKAPTISIDVDAAAGGGSQVDIWMSAYHSRYGLRTHAQLVWRKKRLLAQRLQMATSTTRVAGSGVPTGTSANGAAARTQGALMDPGTKGAFLRVIQDSEMNLLVRSKQPPDVVIKALRSAVVGLTNGSDVHLIFGPPRATMWAHIEELPEGDTLLAVSLMTRDNPDRELVKEQVQGPLESRVAPQLGATVQVVPGSGLPTSLRDQILNGRIVPLEELSV